MRDLRETILWFSALRLIRKYRPFVIGIGGAIAKTSTKEAVGDILRDIYPNQVQVSYGNLNTYLGVPLTILGFEIDFYEKPIRYQWFFILIRALLRSFTRKIPRYLVLEYGTDKPGDIPALVDKIKPNIALLTIVGPAHLENYSSERAIAEEERALIEAVDKDGLVILNKQDPYYNEHLQNTKAKIKTVNCSLEKIAEEFAVELAAYFDMPRKKAEDILSQRQLPKHRFNTFKIKNWLILDDSYNANPLSMKAALNILRNTQSKRRVAILGDMLELGENSKKMHQEIGKLAHQDCDLIIGIGQMSKEYQPDFWYSSSDEAIQKVLAHLEDGDTILVKGSHGIKMEKIIKKLNGTI